MSEKLEEKYKYMCKLVEQQMASILKAGKIVDENEKLKDYIDNIAGIIYNESPLRDQDYWLQEIMTAGYFKPEEDNE